MPPVGLVLWFVLGGIVKAVRGSDFSWVDAVIVALVVAAGLSLLALWRKRRADSRETV